MNDFNVDPDVIARYARDAERMRAEAVAELFMALGSRLRRVGATVANAARRVADRRKWNLSVPAPHR